VFASHVALTAVVTLICLAVEHAVGMTKIKMSSEEAGSLEFVERRRAALERSVNDVSSQ